MSITYEEALSTLEAMFGAPWTRDTLDAVLRHEKGHMENTCDRILNHGSGSPQSLLDKLANGGGGGESLNADEELARSIQQQEQRRSMPTATSTSSTNAAAAAMATTVPSQKKKQRGTPTNLPKDFLRIPGYLHPSLAAERKSSAAVVDDETLARMLQDELFSQELARNPDFAHLARGRSSAGNGRFPARRTSAGTAAGAAAGTQEEGPKIIEKLSEMGDTARKRLAIFAAQFEQRMKNVNNNINNNNNRPNAFQNIFKGATGAGGGSGSGGLSAMAPFNNSTAAAAERRGLLDDDDDQDVIEFEMRKNK